MKHALLAAALAAWLGITGTAHAGGDVQAGKAKADPCAGCHGPNGEGSSSYPALAGTPEDKFIAAINEYKSGKRSNAVMKAFAKKLTDPDVADLAAYYASLKGK
jgi:cytochrome c553